MELRVSFLEVSGLKESITANNIDFHRLLHSQCESPQFEKKWINLQTKIKLSFCTFDIGILFFIYWDSETLILSFKAKKIFLLSRQSNIGIFLFKAKKKILINSLSGWQDLESLNNFKNVNCLKNFQNASSFKKTFSFWKSRQKKVCFLERKSEHFRKIKFRSSESSTKIVIQTL